MLPGEPLLSAASVRWTLPSERACSDCAQQFHFDVDHSNWIKFFLYVTDVDDESGPYTFIPSSQERPLSFWSHRRYSDAEVASVWPASAIERMVGKAGTVFAANTKLLHKAGEARAGRRRVVLEVQFANSLFGGFHPVFVNKSLLRASSPILQRRQTFEIIDVV